MATKNILIPVFGSFLIACNSDQDTEECLVFNEPGTYEVKPCDVFPGGLFGIDAQVTNLDGEGNVVVSYLDSNGKKLFDSFISPFNYPIAHYGIKVYHAGASGTVVRTNNVMELYQKCAEGIGDTDVSICSKVAPIEALPGEILEISPARYYFGKTNNPEFPQLASCSAKSLENVVIHTSVFLGLPPLEPGVSSLDIFMENPPSTGTSYGSLAVWYFDKQDKENTEYNIEHCNKAIEEENFSQGDHEITHLFVRGMYIPRMFNEGLANYVPTEMQGKAKQWDVGLSECQEEGLKVGYELHPYMKYDQGDDQNFDYYLSGECFWVKLVHDYGKDIIPQVMRALDEHKWEKQFTFEDALSEAGVDRKGYAQFGVKDLKRHRNLYK